MASLEAKLDKLGLAQYTNAFIDNGFEDWDTVVDITEDDLVELGVKMGHRRVLQREISIHQAQTIPPEERRTPSTTQSGTEPLSPPTAAEEPLGATNGRRPKRRYRWHPRADPHAPKRPKTAYVNFADHLRTDSDVAGMTFVDIAREVGRRWQVMDAETKQEWENQAAAAMQTYEDQMEAYRKTKPYQDYQDYLQTFKKAPGKSARQKLKNESPRHSYSLTNGMLSLPSPTFSPDHGPQKEYQKALANAMFELRRFKMEYNDVQPYSPHNLPPEETCKQAIGALIEGTGSLIHLFSVPAAQKIIHRAYHSGTEPDNLTVSELCVVAAIGGHIGSVNIPEPIIRKMFASTYTLLDTVDMTEGSYLRVMRILLCLSTYSVAEKHLSARAFISAGLSIARWQYPKLLHSNEPQEVREDWRKVYRSLIFMECLLSYTIGFTPDNISIHIQNAVDTNLSESSVENAIQWQAVQISIIGSDISTAINQPQGLIADHVRYFVNQLDLWRRSLPPVLQLTTLLSSPRISSLGPEQERSMLMVHLLYLGAIILLYRQLLVSAEGTLYASQSLANFSETELHQYRMDAQLAAQQIARVLDNLKSSDQYMSRCWLTIYWAFTASNVLLFGAARSLRDHVVGDVDNQLSGADSCLSVLRLCAKAEPISARFLSMMKPTYDALRSLQQRAYEDSRRCGQSDHKIRINDLLESPSSDSSPSSPRSDPAVGRAISEEASGVVMHASMLLKDPFGRTQPAHESSSIGEYPTPPPSDMPIFWFR